MHPLGVVQPPEEMESREEAAVEGEEDMPVQAILLLIQMLPPEEMVDAVRDGLCLHRCAMPNLSTYFLAVF